MTKKMIVSIVAIILGALLFLIPVDKVVPEPIKTVQPVVEVPSGPRVVLPLLERSPEERRGKGRPIDNSMSIGGDSK